MIKYGSLTKTHKLDDDGSALRTTVYKKANVIEPMVMLEYTVRHRVTKKEEEDAVIKANQARQEAHKMFNVSISYESKHKLQQNNYYYVIEKFTVYRRWQELPHVKAFVEEERREFML